MASSRDAFSAPPSIPRPSLILQKLPAQYHWALADEALLCSISRGEPMVRGIRGRRLRDLVKIGQKIGVVWLLLWLVGAVELFRLLFRQLMASQNEVRRSGDYPARFFVGFGAGPEERLFDRYCDEHPGNVGRLDQVKIGSFAEWHRVGVLRGLRSLTSALADARKAVAALPIEFIDWHADFLTFIGIRAGHFAYMRAWFAMLKTRAGAHLQEIVFLAADTTAYAAADVKLPICFHQHGLIPYCILPNFTRVEALTRDEAAFMMEALPQAHITLRSQANVLTPRQLAKEILVASIYGDASYLSRIAPVIAWARDMRIPIRVRPHPRENSTFWSDYEADIHVTIEKGDAGFSQAMDRLRPRLVVSWFSTALADALEQGVVPVTVCADDDRNVADMVYPLFRRCLRWPHDAGSMARLLDDDEYYASVLSRLRN